MSGLFIFREARASDEDAVVALAQHLNTLNLPPSRPYIRQLLSVSADSFGGGERGAAFDPARRFLFVLESPDSGAVVGTSMIFAQHGTPEEPHVFFRMAEEERFANLGAGDMRRAVHMRHTTLTLGMTYDGPSEVGGLVLHPDFRGHPQKLGRLLSLGRFVYVAMRRAWFRDRFLAELLPPLTRAESGTRSKLWDAIGRRFTGLSYDEADALSRQDKRFIWRLFPMNPVHVSLLPEAVSDVIGTVGQDSQGARRLLQRIGFRPSDRIDPFDGGPHYEAETDALTPVRDAVEGRPQVRASDTNTVPAIVGVSGRDGQGFRAAWTPVSLMGDDDITVGMSRDSLARLGLLDDVDDVVEGARVTVAVRPRRRREDRL